jgi:hypothetical protein
LVLVAGILVAFAIVSLPPSPHEVSSPGSIPTRAEVFDSDPAIHWLGGGPSQSLADIRCIVGIQVQNQTNPCDAKALSHFRNLSQQPQVLYLVWAHCHWNDSQYVRSQGVNLDFQPASRTLVIHCYAATPWLLWPTGNTGAGTRPSPLTALLVVRTASIGPGPITIREDDRLEHLLGDQSTEFQVGTATIF